MKRRIVPENIYESILFHGDESRFRPKPCSKPTKARPGSEEKIRVIRARVAAGEELWHPADETVLTDRPSSTADSCLMRRLKALSQVRVRNAT